MRETSFPCLWYAKKKTVNNMNASSPYLPPQETVDELADFFGAFSDRTRMRILTLLSVGDYCVNDVAYLVGLNQSAVSHQLRNLKERNLVDCKKEGKKTIYYLKNSKINDLLLQAVLASEEPT